MSFGTQVHHHRFYNQPSAMSKQIYDTTGHSRYQSQLPKSIVNVDQSMISMKQSYLKSIKSPNLLKRDQLGYQSVKFNKDIIDRYACDFIRDNQILQKFRKQAEQLKKNKKYHHVNTKSNFQPFPVLHSYPLQRSLKQNKLQMNQADNNSRITNYEVVEQDRARSHIKKFNIEQELAQNLQEQNGVQLCDVGINAKLDEQNRSSLKDKKHAQKKYVHQKKQKQKIRRKYESLKKKVMKQKIKQSRGSRSAFEISQQKNLGQSTFVKQLDSLSQMIQQVSIQLHSNNQFLKQKFDMMNSSKLPSFQNTKKLNSTTNITCNPEQSIIHSLQQLPKQQTLSQKKEPSQHCQSQRLKKKSLYQKFTGSKNTRFYTQVPQIKGRQQYEHNQNNLPRIEYTGNKKIKFDGLRLLKNKLDQIRPYSLASFNSKRFKTQNF